MLNYAVDPELLVSRVPPGTVLDSYKGTSYVSLVGFCFLGTRLFGARIPFHDDFEEVNLRFYVKRIEDNGEKRGVAFIREIVPRIGIATVARLAFNENYVAMPMSHVIEHERGMDSECVSVEYRWSHHGAPYRIALSATGPPATAGDQTLEQFITEHYWGYAAQRWHGSLEYKVVHQPWRIWNAADARFEGEAGALYGAEFARALNREPDSAFLAEGSAVTVLTGRRIS